MNESRLAVGLLLLGHCIAISLLFACSGPASLGTGEAEVGTPQRGIPTAPAPGTRPPGSLVAQEGSLIEGTPRPDVSSVPTWPSTRVRATTDTLLRQMPGSTDVRDSVSTPTPGASAELTIAFLLAAQDTPRQMHFKRLWLELSRTFPGTAIVESADGDFDKQRAQVEQALARGASVLVIQPVDPDRAATFVDAAHKNDARVIAFDRLVNTRDLDALVAYDWQQIGQLQAQTALAWLQAKGLKPPYNFVFLEGAAGDPTAAAITQGYQEILNPLILKNQVKIVLDAVHSEWSAAQAQKSVQDALTKTRNNLHAVLANSSSLARGALIALAAQKLGGKVFVGGADGDEESIRELCAGNQTFDVARDDTALATAAAKLAILLAETGSMEEVSLPHDTLKVEDRQVLRVGIPVKPLTLDTIQAQLFQSGLLDGHDFPNCYPPLAQGANVPTVGVRGTLNVWVQESADSPLFNYLANLAAHLAAANPGIEIQLTAHTAESLRDRFGRVITDTRGVRDSTSPTDVHDSVSTEPPDLILTTNEQIQLLAARDLLQPVTFVTPTLFVESANAAATRRGVQYGLPVFSGDNLMLYYNKKLIKEPPTNTDALVRLAPSYTKEAIGQWMLVFDQTDPFWLFPWIGGFKGSLINNGAPTLNTRAMTETLTLLKTFKDKKVIPPEGDRNTAAALFQEGKATMIIMGDEALDTYLAKWGSDLGIARIPQVSKNEFPRPYTGGVYFAFPRTTDGNRLAIAQAFAQFVTSKPIQLDMARKLHRLPALREALNDSVITNDPLLKGMADQMLLGIAPPDSAALGCIYDAVRPQLQAVMTDQSKPDAAAQAMQASAEACFAKLNRP